MCESDGLAEVVGDCVDTITMDDFVLVRGNPAPTFMKIDVEGAEGGVLSGAGTVLKEARPTILLDLQSPTQDVAAGKVFLSQRYVVYRTNKTGEMTSWTSQRRGPIRTEYGGRSLHFLNRSTVI